MQTIGQRIRARREALGISRAELAKAAGISPTTLSDLELDRSKSTTQLHRIAQHLSVGAEWLATGRGNMEASQPVSRLASTIVARLNETGLTVANVHARLTSCDWPHGHEAPDLHTVESWFAGKQRPLDVIQLRALYDVLGLSLDEHLSTAAMEPRTAMSQAMLERYERLSAIRQAKILALLQDDDE